GTYAAPTIFVPILDESLKYMEERYYSEQIRQQTIVSDVKQGYYHVEGDVNLEVDPTNSPYWMYAARHNAVKSGAGPFVYTFTPSSAGSASTATGTTAAKTLSITIVRNGVVFGYTGCVVGGFEFTIEDAVLRCSLNILGLAEAVQSAPSRAWAAADLLGADAHRIYVAAASATPTFTTASLDFNGFTFRANYNAEAQNRIRADRQASYISYGITEAEIESELDFIDRTEYDNFVNNT